MIWILAMRFKRLGFIILVIVCTGLFVWIMMQQEHLLSISGTQPEPPKAGFIVAQRGNKLPLYVAVSSLHRNDIEQSTQQRQKRKSFLYSNNTKNLIVTDIKDVANYHAWHEICGLQIDNLLHHPLFPNLPYLRTFVHSLKLQNIEVNLGFRIFGYIIPEMEGSYQFYIKANDVSVEVWLSSDTLEENSKLLCKDPGDDDNSSRVKEISLLRDLEPKQYYFEILGKTGNSKGSMELQWLKPKTRNFQTILSKNLKPFFNDMMYHERQVVLDYTVKEGLPMHRLKPMRESYYFEKNVRRRSIYELPYIPETETFDLFPECPYSPSYLIGKPLSKNEGVWETHYSSVYPADDTDLKYRLKGQLEQVIFGNDLLDEKETVFVVDGVMEALNRKLPGKYILKEVVNIELNDDPVKGKRFLVELELLELSSSKNLRFSEYIYHPKGTRTLCYPEGFRWNKSADVNVILTVGNQARWAKHFIDTMANIYAKTKDENLNVIIVDFDSKDIDMIQALEESGLKRYTLIKRSGGFHKTEAIQEAANTVLDSNAITLQVDLHLTIPNDFIDNVRKHCVKGKMTYSPLLVRLQCGAYPQRPFGFWEVAGYGIFGIYKSDWDSFGGMDVVNFRNKWGGEDWDLLDRVLTAGYEVERLKIPDFNHIFHTKKGMWQTMMWS